MATGPCKVLPIISGLAWASSVVQPTCNNVGRRDRFAHQTYMLEARTTHGVVALLNLHEDAALLNLHATALAAGLAVSGQYNNLLLVAVRRTLTNECYDALLNNKQRLIATPYESYVLMDSDDAEYT